MAGATPQIEWYIARDGQQYGPLTDLEMQKFVDLGHLRPSDLVWRQGYPDWRPALAAFPPPTSQRPEHAPPPPRAMHQPSTQAREPQQQQQATYGSAPHGGYRQAEPVRSNSAPVAVSASFDDDDDIDGDDEDIYSEKPRRRGLRYAILLILIALLGGAIWLGMDLFPSPDKLISLIQAPANGDNSADVPVIGREASAPSQNTGTADAGLDAEFQRIPLWQLLKREFPDWYRERMQEAARLRSEGGEEATITRRMAESVVALRRQHAQQALAASPTVLRTIAESFLNNLQHLSSQSVQACYGFISQGETSPQVLELMNSPEHAEQIQKQVIAVFEAVAEGRRSPQTHLPPRQTDYAALSQALTGGRGWTDREIQLFSNPRALAQAPAEEVCKLVQDWFGAQLSIPDEDVQLRLLIESLKPVVAG